MTTKNHFFCNIDNDYIDKLVLNNLTKYFNENFQHGYLINRPLSEKKYDYTVNKVLILLCPDYNIQFINLNLGQSEFDEIYLDFIEDLGHIADKYNYTNIISRPREWKAFLKQINKGDFFETASNSSDFIHFMEENKLKLDLEKRTVKLLISLLTGSINSSEKIGKELPKSTLEKVKQNIILFDGDQTSFIFEENYSDKIIKIQGLAGTGKTELLLHRLKEIYITNKESKIVFTCQSKTLSNKLKNRVTEFFNFMKVEEQIEWEERLWVMHAWGSVKDFKNLGTYGLICRQYKLPFYNTSEGTFAFACKKTLEYIKSLKIIIDPIFDYMLIDEGQDFTEDFIELCSLVTKNQVFVAGDIFQDIFGIQKIESSPNYLLNKCYRTDPRTLMFSHALGLALYESPSLRFLKDEEWQACGYTFSKENGNYILKRERVSRFEDIDDLNDSSGMNIIEYSDYEDLSIIEIIKQIKVDFPDVAPDDIAIVFPNGWLNYRKIGSLEVTLYQELGWDANILHNTKQTSSNTITVSNKNNIKGLEFPFVICVVDYEVTRDLSIRNTLYMTLTRSFISSYLLIQKSGNVEFVKTLRRGLEEINNSLKMTIPEPSQDERDRQDNIIKHHNKPALNQHEILDNIFDELDVLNLKRPDLRNTVIKFRPNEINTDNLKEFILTLMGGKK